MDIALASAAFRTAKSGKIAFFQEIAFASAVVTTLLEKIRQVG